VLTNANELGFELRGLTYSPITGGEGNIEFLAYWQLSEQGKPLPEFVAVDLSKLIKETVEEASSTFHRS
jgi:23S rRNA (cytidine1920-2'-O)/16S rRNA (cytidine1409-2'-O)-methyltransferase